MFSYVFLKFCATLKCNGFGLWFERKVRLNFDKVSPPLCSCINGVPLLLLGWCTCRQLERGCQCPASVLSRRELKLAKFYAIKFELLSHCCRVNVTEWLREDFLACLAELVRKSTGRFALWSWPLDLSNERPSWRKRCSSTLIHKRFVFVWDWKGVSPI